MILEGVKIKLIAISIPSHMQLFFFFPSEIDGRSFSF